MNRHGDMEALYRKGLWALAGAIMALWSLAACAPRTVTVGVALDTPEHHVLSGMKLLDSGRYQDARSQFELAIQKAPWFTKAYVGKGLVAGYQGNCRNARQAIEKAATMAKTDDEKAFAAIGLIRLALICQDSVESEPLQAARAAYVQALAVFPDSAEAHYYMAVLYESAGDILRARTLFQRVVEINQSHVLEARDALRRIQGEE
ncbi:MAG: tetratricopeptide repeat protein [Deltaproteobacteria bacterium]|nr:tetratricopeptide repeat protein [Deltaproteobacteria bacterium]